MVRWARGSGSKSCLVPKYAGEPWEAPQGITELSPEDQVVVVGAGTKIVDLQAALATHGLCLPLPDPAEFGDAPAGLPGTVGGGIAMNLPHGLEYQTGNWRDWVLGLTILRADGTSAKCGSRAVKNVAGYDVARLMVGARGELGFIVEAILRLYPLRALPRPAVVGRAEWGNRPSGKRSIVRTNAEAWEPLLAEQAKAIQATDPMTRTAWLCDIPTLPADAVAWTSDPPYISVSQAHRQLMHRAKAIFDPESSLQRQ